MFMDIYDKISNLKNSLEKEKTIIEIKQIQNEILNDKELLNNIKENKNYRENKKIINYLHLENELNYMILTIRGELKSILRSDKSENHSRKV